MSTLSYRRDENIPNIIASFLYRLHLSGRKHPNDSGFEKKRFLYISLLQKHAVGMFQLVEEAKRLA